MSEPQGVRRTEMWVHTTPARASVLTPVLDLDDDRAQNPDVAGAKAASLARARSSGLPALPGFVITVEGARVLDDRSARGADAFAVHDAWRQLSEDGQISLVVRSSSPQEDGASQSMAGMFTSILDVQGWEAFLDAVKEVARSGHDAPMAVLVQPFLQPAWGGVLFGADPVTGRSDRLVVAAVPGGPDRLVSGHVDGAQLTLSPRGRLRDASADAPAALRSRRMLRPLARLASQARLTFGAPQDIEWAIEANGSVVLLQSRPITALGDEADATGPVFGPGPVAETFGLPLRPLEEDLWVAPLRDGLREALTIAGATPARSLRSSPVVVSVGGRVAVDLGLLGLTQRRRSVLSKLDPRPPAAPAEGGMARRAAQGRPPRVGRRSDRGGRPRPPFGARPEHPARSGSAAAAASVASHARRFARARGARRTSPRRRNRSRDCRVGSAPHPGPARRRAR